MSSALKQDDERELLKFYEAEFNQPDLHDRVLIFDVVASWPLNVLNVDENERDKNGDSNQNEDGSDGETAEIENGEIGMNTSDESEAEIASKYADS
jgi:hypothetical protein